MSHVICFVCNSGESLLSYTYSPEGLDSLCGGFDVVDPLEIAPTALFKPSRAEPEPVADECGFSNAHSLLLARDGKVALGEVIRSQWSLSDWWNKCNNNQLMKSSLGWPRGECPLPLTPSLLDVQMLKSRSGSLRVTQIWQITLTRISERRNESCCQGFRALLLSELLKMQSPADLTAERREQSCHVSISLRWEIARKCCYDGSKCLKFAWQ